MLGVEDWGPVLFATLVPVTVLLLGGLVHVVYRLGRADQRLAALEHSLRDLSDQLTWLVRRARVHDHDESS